MRGAVPTVTRGQDGVGPLHTTLRSKRGGKSRKDGDENVEDFTPGGIVVECSHSVKCFSGLDIRLIYQMHHDFSVVTTPLLCGGVRGRVLFPFAKIRHHFSDLYL